MIKTLAPWYQKFVVNGEPTVSKGYMNEDYFNQLLPLIPKDIKGKRVLDLGCNAGFVSFKLASMGARVTGFDNDERYIDQANYIIKNTNVPRVRFILMNIEDLELNGYNADLILILSALYHLEYPESMVEKLCKENCDIIASFRLYNYDYFIEVFKSIGRKR